MKKLNFDETKQSQLPFVEMLINLGYRYIPKPEITTERNGDTSKFILSETARKKLAEINTYTYNGQQYQFSEKDVAETVDELNNIPLDGLIDTSKKIFGMIMPSTGGKTIKVFHDGKYISKSLKYIDFDNIENNDFAVTVEFEASGKNNRRIDIAVFVNGIPFALIENKKSSVDVEVAINQHLRNQSHDNTPRLFVYPQLLIATNKEEFKYGTAKTPSKFYAKWKELDTREEEWKHRKDFDKAIDNKVTNIISNEIDINTYNQALKDLDISPYYHKQVLNRKPTQQDRGVYGLFRKEKLLDFCKNFILYDGGIKKIMRYQQYSAIKKTQQRIKNIIPTKTGERREGGILWQTQGSGKSLTMVMFVKALIEDPTITNPRILIVTDRKDLDRQIRDTFINAGLKKDVIQAKSGSHLLDLIKQKDLRVITTLVHKFHSASKQRYFDSSQHKSGFTDLDKNIFVLIDEAHRTQGGEANLEMNKVIPNACYIAFTGTPLLKSQKSENKFGRFIDKYTIDDALKDGIILPLIYEGRYSDLRQDKKEIDKQTNRLSKSLDKESQKELQRFVKTKLLKDNPQRINEIAYDIEEHYLEQFADTGLKGQIVAPSKYAATLFQKYFKNSGKINTALVISDENGIISEDDDRKQEVDEYLKEIKENYQSLLSYEKEVVKSFKHNEDGIAILIVVDKLLTGFDAPRNTVLYVAKELKDHNLLQAIARVNRLYDNKGFPKTAGYIIDYSENALNIKTAMELFGNYDANDVKGTLIDINKKIEELEDAYNKLHETFKTCNPDDEEYLQYLEDEPTRKLFYGDLNKFIKVFSECNTLQDFVEVFPHLEIYQKELKKFLNLRRTADVRFADHTDLTRYKLALIKIMDKNIKAEEVELLTKQVAINNQEAFQEVLESLASDKSKAETIASQVKKVISEKESTDPEFYKRFSTKIQKLLEDMKLKKIEDIEALKQAKLIQDSVLTKKDTSLPKEINNNIGSDIFYRNLKDDFANYGLQGDQIIEIVLDILHLLKEEVVVDWQVNSEKQRVLRNKIDDYLYDVVIKERGINLSTTDTEKIIKTTIELAQLNYKILINDN